MVKEDLDPLEVTEHYLIARINIEASESVSKRRPYMLLDLE